MKNFLLPKLISITVSTVSFNFFSQAHLMALTQSGSFNWMALSTWCQATGKPEMISGTATFNLKKDPFDPSDEENQIVFESSADESMCPDNLFRSGPLQITDRVSSSKLV